jgi:hypothetical protein
MASRNLSNSNISGSKNSTFYDESTQDGYEIIFTGTVTSGGAASITFSDIPPTYRHLQIRGILRTDQSGNGGSALGMQFNGDTGSNYFNHRAYGNASGFTNDSSGSLTNNPQIGNGSSSGNEVSTFATNIIDIVDYTGTQNKKTARSISGMDFGSAAGYPMFIHMTWNNTNAITSIRLFHTGGNNFVEHTNFSLYGLRG